MLVFLLFKLDAIAVMECILKFIQATWVLAEQVACRSVQGH